MQSFQKYINPKKSKENVISSTINYRCLKITYFYHHSLYCYLSFFIIILNFSLTKDCTVEEICQWYLETRENEIAGPEEMALEEMKFKHIIDKLKKVGVFSFLFDIFIQ